MKTMLVAAALAFATTIFVAGTAGATKTNFHADMEPDEENSDPDLGNHNPYGVGDFTYDDQTKQLCGKIEWFDLTGPASSLFIFEAPNGDPEGDGDDKLPVSLDDAGVGPATCNFTLTAAYEASLKLGELYANAQTAKNPKGEVRGTLNENLLGPVVECLADGGVSLSTLPPISRDAGAATSQSPPPPKDTGCTSSRQSSQTPFAFAMMMSAAAVATIAFRRRKNQQTK